MRSKVEDSVNILISKYHPGGKILGDIVRQNWDILNKSSSTSDVLKWKVTQGFRRPTNRSDILDRATVVDATNPPDQVNTHPTHTKRKGCSKSSCRY